MEGRLLVCTHTPALLICADTCAGVMGACACACRRVFLSLVLGEGTLVSAPSNHSAALGVLGFGFGRPDFESWPYLSNSSERGLPYLENGD